MSFITSVLSFCLLIVVCISKKRESYTTPGNGMNSGMPGDGMYSGMPGDGMYSGMPGDGMYSDMYPGDGGYMPGNGWTDDYTDMPGYGGRRCCPLKAVESPSDESMNEMYALVER